MNRFHVHVAVDDLDRNVQFYSTVFGQAPSVLKHDYAKWMMEDPRINFAISKRSGKFGVNHLGLQVDTDAELTAMRERVAAADIDALDQKGANCCYAKSDKYWITDPQGVAWETYRSLDTIPVYGEDSHKGEAGAEQSDAAADSPAATKVGCCVPAKAAAANPTAPASACGASCC